MDQGLFDADKSHLSRPEPLPDALNRPQNHHTIRFYRRLG
jgi:hypothetical protein